MSLLTRRQAAIDAIAQGSRTLHALHRFRHAVKLGLDALNQTDETALEDALGVAETDLAAIETTVEANYATLETALVAAGVTAPAVGFPTADPNISLPTA